MTVKDNNTLYKRQKGAYEVEPISANDLTDCLNMAIEAGKRGRQEYPDTEDGFLRFKTKSLEYLEYIRDNNNQNIDDGKPNIIPSIESWSCYIGLTRMSVLRFEHQRGEVWVDFIAWMKNAIQSCKLQLASCNKLPALIYIFDAVNNRSGYENTSSIKVEPLTANERTLVSKETPESIAERYRAALADSESKQKIETAENMPD